jgi:hypothetical protein
MARVTSAEVAAMAGLPEEAAGAITQSIPVAATLVDENISGLTEATMRSIELLLACHFSTVSWQKGPLAAVRIGEAQERYHDVYKGGFGSTSFGQQAMLVDTTGTLSAMSAQADKPMRKAQFQVVGTIDLSTDEEES